MSTLTKVDPMSWAKVYAVLVMIGVAIVGLLQIIFAASFSGLISSVGGNAAGVGASVAGFGFLGLIILIPVSGGIAFVVGLITTYILNLVLGWVGGIKLELK